MVVELECIFDPARKEGNAITFMSELKGTVQSGDKKLGTYYGMMGGGVEIHDDTTHQTWVLNADQIVRAYFSHNFEVLEDQDGTQES